MISLPFDLNNTNAYEQWRERKLESAQTYIKKTPPHFLPIFKNGQAPTKDELNEILRQCAINSFCLYRIKDTTENKGETDNSTKKANILELAKQLGVSRLDSNICADQDSLTSITQTSHEGQHDYIPYSNKRLSWHTDGYYNPPARRINTMLLHCAQPAKEGGESLFMDHEIAYILLRDENPDYIEALMQPNAMTIPANILDGKVIREAQTGPVFLLNSQGQLHMRYSARKRNIEWQQNSPTLEALEFLDSLLNSDSDYIIKHTLNAGEGIICRNILHCRTAFDDYEEAQKKRLLFRGRYYDELAISI
jgi:hypothetical protein